MKKSVFEVDSLVATYDRKRVWGIDVERPFLYPGMCIELLNKLASRALRLLFEVVWFPL